MSVLSMCQRKLLEAVGFPLEPSQWDAFTLRRLRITFADGSTRTAYCCGITVGLEPTATRADVHARDHKCLVMVLNGFSSEADKPTPRMPWLVFDLDGKWRLRAHYDQAGVIEDPLLDVSFA